MSGKLAKDQNTGNVYKGVVLKVRLLVLAGFADFTPRGGSVFFVKRVS